MYLNSASLQNFCEGENIPLGFCTAFEERDLVDILKVVGNEMCSMFDVACKNQNNKETKEN